MRQVSIPELNFSPWYSWENRKRYPLKKLPGVYIIAICEKALEGKIPSFSDVVYIGMTVRKDGLIGRWRDLDRCLRKGGGSHSGGESILKDKGDYKDWHEKMYVSGIGIECNVKEPTPEDYIKMGSVAFLEYDGFAKFAAEVRGHPKYNKK